MTRCLLLIAAAIAIPVSAQQLELKTGAWEVTMSGGPLPRPEVSKECMTKADVPQFSSGPDKEDDAECKVDKPPTIAGKTWSVEKSCPGGRRVRVEFTADSPERVKGAITIVPGKDQKASTVQMSAKWLSGSCKGIN